MRPQTLLASLAQQLVHLHVLTRPRSVRSQAHCVRFRHFFFADSNGHVWCMFCQVHQVDTSCSHRATFVQCFLFCLLLLPRSESSAAAALGWFSFSLSSLPTSLPPLMKQAQQ